jgi:hypothetical protein
MGSHPLGTGSITRGLQMAGIVLWRGGLAFVAAYAFYQGAWQALRRMDWPPQVTTGASLALAGLGLVLVSLVLERRREARAEGDLLDDERHFR